MDYGWGQIVISGSFSELTKFHNWFITHARNNTSQEFELHAESMSFETDKQYAWEDVDTQFNLSTERPIDQSRLYIISFRYPQFAPIETIRSFAINYPSLSFTFRWDAEWNNVSVIYCLSHDQEYPVYSGPSIYLMQTDTEQQED